MKNKIMLLVVLSVGLMTTEKTSAVTCPHTLSYTSYQEMENDIDPAFEVYWWAPHFVAHHQDQYTLVQVQPHPYACFYARNMGGGAVFGIQPR